MVYAIVGECVQESRGGIAGRERGTAPDGHGAVKCRCVTGDCRGSPLVVLKASRKTAVALSANEMLPALVSPPVCSVPEPRIIPVDEFAIGWGAIVERSAAQGDQAGIGHWWHTALGCIR